MTDPEQGVDILPLMDSVERGQFLATVESDHSGLSERQKGSAPCSRSRPHAFLMRSPLSSAATVSPTASSIIGRTYWPRNCRRKA